MNSFFTAACLLWVININLISNSIVNNLAEQEDACSYRENTPGGLLDKGKVLLDNGEFDSLGLLLDRISGFYAGQLKADSVISSEYDLLKGKYLNITGNYD